MNNGHKVLFICQHNSGLSQIAEAYLKKFAGADVFVESAGLEPAESVNPLVVEVMREEGIDLSGKNLRVYSSCSNRGSYTAMLSPFAMTPNRSVRFSWELPSAGICLFPIRPWWKAPTKKGSPKYVKSGMPSKNGS